MTSTLLKIVAFTLTATAGSFCFAQMDVDQADSLNFEAFHKDKKESIKVWKDDKTKKEETVKAYDQTNAAPPATAPTTTSNNLSSTPVTTAAPVAAAAALTKPGQRYEVRERYSLSRSAKTPYSAFFVIEPLHQQSARLCPKGWKKLSERSEPVEQDFFQYYEIECL
ncbi:MAG: hypothetical protein ABW049_12605 [Spongiibacteraceae bacterium]